MMRRCRGVGMATAAVGVTMTVGWLSGGCSLHRSRSCVASLQSGHQRWLGSASGCCCWATSMEHFDRYLGQVRVGLWLRHGVDQTSLYLKDGIGCMICSQLERFRMLIYQTTRSSVQVNSIWYVRQAPFRLQRLQIDMLTAAAFDRRVIRMMILVGLQ